MADSPDVSAAWPSAPKTFFDWLLERWPDPVTVQRLREAVHAADVERASVPPVVNVTLAGVPGHFTGTAGQGDAAYVPEVPNSPA